MDTLTLYVGNQNYSSWSLRPWIALEAAGIAFETVVIPFDFAAGNPKFRELSPPGRVPVLKHGDVTVWESLAIIEYAAELFPQAGLWPQESALRAEARAVSMEMLSGFRALRGACPMNMRRPRRMIDLPDGVTDDVARIETIWRDARRRSGGPFLYGNFGAADAMYAPVVNRFDVYGLITADETLDYMAAVQAHPAYVKWKTAALAETWIVAEDEA